MSVRPRLSVLFFIGMLLAGSTALGYYYFYVYSPPLKAADRFMTDMEKRDEQALKSDIIISIDVEEGKLREPTLRELQNLLSEPFRRGRILDQRRQEGRSRDLYYLVYREPDGRVYALMAAPYKGRYRIVIPEVPMSRRHRYLWDYTWTN
jgi:hypothetical protein